MYWDFALFNLLFVLEIKDFKNREIIEWKWMFDIWDKHMDGVGGVAAHQYWFVRFQLCGVLLCLYASKGVGVDKYLDPFVSLATRAHVSVSKVRKQQKRKWESVLSPDSLQILRTKVSDRNIGHGNVQKYKFLFYVVKKQKVSDFYLGHLVCMIHVTRVTKLLNLTQILINTLHKHTRKSWVKMIEINSLLRDWTRHYLAVRNSRSFTEQISQCVILAKIFHLKL